MLLLQLNPSVPCPFLPASLFIPPLSSSHRSRFSFFLSGIFFPRVALAASLAVPHPLPTISASSLPFLIFSTSFSFSFSALLFLSLLLRATEFWYLLNVAPSLVSSRLLVSRSSLFLSLAHFSRYIRFYRPRLLVFSPLLLSSPSFVSVPAYEILCSSTPFCFCARGWPRAFILRVSLSCTLRALPASQARGSLKRCLLDPLITRWRARLHGVHRTYAI